jgi:hypothetical protein
MPVIQVIDIPELSKDYLVFIGIFNSDFRRKKSGLSLEKPYVVNLSADYLREIQKRNLKFR